MWLPQANFVAVEVASVRAGVIPIPTRAVVQIASCAAQSVGLDLEWRQHQGRPVALVRLAKPETHSAIRLDRVELSNGEFYIAGRSRHSPASSARDSSSSDLSMNAPAANDAKRR
jgi:hypothetical protein